MKLAKRMKERISKFNKKQCVALTVVITSLIAPIFISYGGSDNGSYVDVYSVESTTYKNNISKVYEELDEATNTQIKEIEYIILGLIKENKSKIEIFSILSSEGYSQEYILYALAGIECDYKLVATRKAKDLLENGYDLDDIEKELINSMFTNEEVVFALANCN